jgi:hypothetical protein
MNVYILSSKNFTNIWAAIGAGMWATSHASPQDRAARLTRSRSMLPGSFGLLYCTSNHSLTTPFIVVSQAEDRVISDIWPALRAWRSATLPPKMRPRTVTVLSGRRKFHGCFRSRWRLCVRPLDYPADRLADFVHASHESPMRPNQASERAARRAFALRAARGGLHVNTRTVPVAVAHVF